jgi:ABC-type nitrate/sulfonate/bicarbonate transport system substrate-binding protein
MKRIVILASFAVIVLALAGCQPAATPARPGSGSATTTASVSTSVTAAGNPDRPSLRIGTLGKTVLFQHVVKVYDPKKFPKTSMNGEPSDIPFFKPEKDEGLIPRDYPRFDNKTFKFLAMMSTMIPPQDYYMLAQGGLNKAVAKTGYKFAEILDGGHVKILPNFYLGYYDFAWVPLNVITEYWSGNESMSQELWRNGNDYQIIGASYDGGVSLIAPPGTTDIKQLANSKIGIMNPSYNQEAMLNKKLGTLGLATEAAGGNVGIEMGTPGFVMNDLMANKLKAVIAWASYEQQLRKKFGYKELLSWSDMGYGKKVPYMVLVVRKDIAAKHPDIVQAVVQANHDATQRAINVGDFKKDIYARTDYFKSHYMGMDVKVQDINPKLMNLDAQANPAFLKDVYDYMTKVGYFKVPYAFGELVNESFYNKVKR